jgi:hypothetical protein
VLRHFIIACAALASLVLIAPAALAASESATMTAGKPAGAEPTPTATAQKPAATNAGIQPAAAASKTSADKAAATPPADRLTLAVALDPPAARVFPGEPLTVRITLHNATPGPLMVPDWDHFDPMIDVEVRISGYPEAGASADAAAPPVWTGVPFQKSDFRELPPGDTVITRTVTPLLPGKVHLAITVTGPSDTYAAPGTGRPVVLENAWIGHLAAALAVDAEASESPAATARYADVRARLADPAIAGDEKGRLLASIGDEKHYYAAQFLRSQCEALTPGTLRDSCLFQLLGLAKFGTAYDAVPLLLVTMSRSQADQQLRTAILDWTTEMLLQKGHQSIADQATYEWPEVLQKEARDEIVRLKSDRNPYLAARARDALLKLDAQKK